MNSGKIHDYGSSVTASIDKLIQLNQIISKHFIIAFIPSVVLLLLYIIRLSLFAIGTCYKKCICHVTNSKSIVHKPPYRFFITFELGSVRPEVRGTTEPVH